MNLAEPFHSIRKRSYSPHFPGLVHQCACNLFAWSSDTDHHPQSKELFPKLPFKASLATRTLGSLYFLFISLLPVISTIYLAFSAVQNYDNFHHILFPVFLLIVEYKPNERSHISVWVTAIGSKHLKYLLGHWRHSMHFC